LGKKTTTPPLLISYGATVSLEPGERESGFADNFPFDEKPQQLADFIIQNYARPTDDALALVTRYNGIR